MIDTILSLSVSTVIAVSALLGLVLLTRRAVTRRFGARAAYALWLLPALRLVTPPINLPPQWGLSRWFASISAEASAPAPTYVGYYDGPVTVVETPASFNLADLGPTALLTLWTLGILVGALWMIIRHRRYMSHLNQTSVAPDTNLGREITRALRLSGLKSTPDVRVSLMNDGPMVCGLFRPVIVLPAAFTTQFTAPQRQLALLHELTHIKRGDLWTATAMMVFRLLSWPNPLVHMAWPRFRADQEAACDASVLRLTGEAARADYAETLLTAAKTSSISSGRATPATGTGLTLSLHHPVKERLMTLGTSNTSRQGASRWGLAALLLTGAAITAPLSFADGPPKPETAKTTTTSTTSQKSMQVIRSQESADDQSGYEIRNEDGVKTFLRVSRDGTTEHLTREQLEAEYDIDVDALLVTNAPPAPPMPPQPLRLNGEPGLQALSLNPANQHVRTMIVTKADGQDDQSFEFKVEDGVKRIFRISEDGERTEVSEDEMGESVDIKKIFVHRDDRFPTTDGDRKVRVFTTNTTSEWISSDDEGPQIGLLMKDGSNAAMAEGRLRAAETMLASSDKLLADLRETAEGSALRDLRDAERELEKARKALKKSRAALQKSNDR